VIIQYWGEKGKDGEDGYTGWYFQPEGRCGCTEGKSDRMM